MKVENLQEGARNVSIFGRIVSVEQREVEVKGEKKFVFSGLLGDETGKIRFSAWADFKLEEDEVVQIDGAYVKTWRGIPQLTFDERSKVERVQEDIPSMDDIMKGAKMSIGDIDGGVDLVVEGVVADVKEGSGLIYRCPECNRVAKKGSCSIHGSVDALPDLRVKAIVDDGTGALTVLLGKKLTAGVLKKDLDKCLEETRNSPNPELIKDELYELLVTKPMRFRGNVLKDDFGLTMIGDSAEFVKIDLKGEAKDMLDGLEI
jgi:replication factor A1